MMAEKESCARNMVDTSWWLWQQSISQFSWVFWSVWGVVEWDSLILCYSMHGMVWNPKICSFNEGVVDTSHVLPGQARGEQSDWIATFAWDEDNCCRWVLGIGNHGWLTALLLKCAYRRCIFVLVKRMLHFDKQWFQQRGSSISQFQSWWIPTTNHLRSFQIAQGLLDRKLTNMSELCIMHSPERYLVLGEK